MGAHGSKLWVRIAGRAALAWSLLHFAMEGDWQGGVIVCRDNDQIAVHELLADLGCLGWDVVTGGVFRHQSVKCGLDRLHQRGMAPDDVVLIHDAARLLVTKSLIREISMVTERSGAAVPVLPVVDTVKRISSERLEIVGTLERSQLALAQTPQGFRSEWIMAGYEAWALGIPTDDSQVVEALGKPVTWVSGDGDNRKLTTPEDLAWFTWKVKERHGL